MPPKSSHSFLLTSRLKEREMDGIKFFILKLLRQGHPCFLYCIYDGIFNVRAETFQKLKNEGLKLIGCAYAAEQRHIPTSDQAVFGGLGMLADVILHSDSFAQLPLKSESSPSTKSSRLTLRPRLSNPSPEDLFEIYRVGAGLSAATSLKISLTTLVPLPEKLLQNPDFLNLQKTCEEHRVEMSLDKKIAGDACSGNSHSIVIEF